MAHSLLALLPVRDFISAFGHLLLVLWVSAPFE